MKKIILILSAFVMTAMMLLTSAHCAFAQAEDRFKGLNKKELQETILRTEEYLLQKLEEKDSILRYNSITIKEIKESNREIQHRLNQTESTVEARDELIDTLRKQINSLSTTQSFVVSTFPDELIGRWDTQEEFNFSEVRINFKYENQEVWLRWLDTSGPIFLTLVNESTNEFLVYYIMPDESVLYMEESDWDNYDWTYNIFFIDFKYENGIITFHETDLQRYEPWD